MAYNDGDPTFMLHYTESVGFWGSIFVCALPWILVVIYMATDSTLLDNIELTLWNLIGGVVVWCIYFIVHILFTPRFAAFARARISMNSKCIKRWG